MAVEALKESGMNVKGMLAIFSYGFTIAEENFQQADVTLHTLSNYENLLIKAEKSNYIKAAEASVLSQWREDPANWNPALSI